MAAPPLYKNIDKHAKDLLTKDYEKSFPSVKVESKADNEVHYSVEARKDTKTGEFVVDPLSYKYNFIERGMSLVVKANTNRKLIAELSVTDKFAKGLKVVTALGSTFVSKPDQNPENSAKLGLEYVRDNFASNSEFELFKKIASVAAVVGNKTVAVGGEVELNLNDGTPTKYNTAASYNAGSFYLTASLTDKFQTLGSSFFRKVNDNTSLAGEFAYKLNSADTSFTVGVHHKIDKDSSLKAKFNNRGVVTLGYLHYLRKNIRAGYTLEVDASNLNKADASKLGFGLTFTDE
jgi:voltage-dependent anion channel protein 2